MRISYVQLFMAALFIYNSAMFLFSFTLLVFTRYILIILTFKIIFSAMTLVNCIVLCCNSNRSVLPWKNHVHWTSWYWNFIRICLLLNSRPSASKIKMHRTRIIITSWSALTATVSFNNCCVAKC